MGRDVRLRVSIVVILEDPMVEILHMLHLEALLLTFPSGMPLPGVKREAGAAVKSIIQCVVKVKLLVKQLVIRTHPDLHDLLFVNTVPIYIRYTAYVGISSLPLKQ